MIKTKLELLRSTKNTYVYSEVGGADAIRTLYIQKSALSEPAKKISVEIKEDEQWKIH